MQSVAYAPNSKFEQMVRQAQKGTGVGARLKIYSKTYVSVSWFQRKGDEKKGLDLLNVGDGVSSRDERCGSSEESV